MQQEALAAGLQEEVGVRIGGRVRVRVSLRVGIRVGVRVRVGAHNISGRLQLMLIAMTRFRK